MRARLIVIERIQSQRPSQVSWRGTLAQYAGKLHKREVVIYDYVDADEPLVAKMAGRREAGYRALGYDVPTLATCFPARQRLP